MPSFNVSFGSGGTRDNSRRGGNNWGDNNHTVNMPPKLTAVVAVLIGVAFLIVAAFLYNSAQNPDSKTATVDGVVVNVDQRRDVSPSAEGGDIECRPEVTYTVDGNEYTVSDDRYSGWRCPWNVGGAVPVRYDPAAPAEGTLQPPAQTYTAVIFGAVGIVIIGGGIFSYPRRR